MYNAARRPTWWGQDPDSPGAYPNVAAAAVVCVEHYLRNPKKLTAQQLLDLHAYLNSLGSAPVLQSLIIAPAADKTGEYLGFEGGNRLDGRPLFYAACHSCHPNGDAGIAPAIPRDREPGFYARKIREGDGLGAVLSGVDPNAYDEAAGLFMPFFGADGLTNQDIRDLVAYIKSLEPLPPLPPPPKPPTRSKAKPKARP
jgi:mono/diheme cytochrome c family protein